MISSQTTPRSSSPRKWASSSTTKSVASGFAAVHGIIELVAQDFGGAHDDRRIGVFLAVPGQDAHVGRAEVIAENSIVFGIGQGFEGRCIPGPAALLENSRDGLLRDPGFAGAGGRRHQAVGSAGWPPGPRS